MGSFDATCFGLTFKNALPAWCGTLSQASCGKNAESMQTIWKQVVRNWKASENPMQADEHIRESQVKERQGSSKEAICISNAHFCSIVVEAQLVGHGVKGGGRKIKEAIGTEKRRPG